MKSCMQGKAKKREREINDYNLHIKWIKMNEFCLNKIINDFEWYIIAPKKSAKINDALFLFVKELSALACGFLALGKWQINWNDENRVARPTEQDFTQRLLGYGKEKSPFKVVKMQIIKFKIKYIFSLWKEVSQKCLKISTTSTFKKRN